MPNVLLLMADEHSPKALGAYGNQQVRTPNLDALAAGGLVHESAYCASPICVPSRASVATGRFPHELGCWDNNEPYTGREGPSFGHRLVEAGCTVVTVGKLHYRSSVDPTGFPDQRLAMHVDGGSGSSVNLLRGRRPYRGDGVRMLAEAGPGEAPYFAYDRSVASEAIRWLREDRRRCRAPWALQVSFASPHFPLLAPERYYRLYEDLEVPEPADAQPSTWPRHPALDFVRRVQGLDGPLPPEQRLRAVRAYYGLVTYVDALVGEVLEALDAAGLAEETLVVYTSDHGEMLGAHGLWKKSLMYEESVGVPLLLRGPDLAGGSRSAAPVSLVDLAETIVETVAGAPRGLGDGTRRLTSPGAGHDRPVLAEYHALWSRNAIYMVRKDRYKYVHYTYEEPQLFDLLTDPGELRDLAACPDLSGVVGEMESVLRSLLDPEEVDRRAKRDQQALLERLGGERAALEVGDRFFFTPVPAGLEEGGDHGR